VRTLEVAARAGAIALARSEIAVGTHAGVARFSYPELAPISTLDGLWKEGCSGLQFAGGGLVMLGHDVGQSVARPADWKHSLVHVDERDNQRRVPVGPGNWTMVKGLSGTTAVLYDESEHQGARAVNTDEATCSWAVSDDFRRIVSAGGDRLLGLTERALVELSVTRGPPPGGYRLEVEAASGAYLTAVVDHVRGGDEGVTVQLVRGARISGRVETADGTAVRGASRVRTHDAQSGREDVGGKVAEDGSFQTSVVAPGRRLDVVADAPAGWVRARVRGAPAGRDAVRVLLAPAVALEGRLLDAHGEPASDHGVVVVSDRDGEEFQGEARTNREGLFRVYAPAGPVRLLVRRHGGTVELGTWTAPATDLTLRLGE
jgi:hypothetical protein